MDDLISFLPAGACRKMDMAEGDVLFAQNQPTTGMYHVQSGGVALERSTLAGDRLLLHKAVAGGFFAEASIFSQIYHCDAICIQDGSVLRIAKSEVITLMGAVPAFGVVFTKHLAQQVQQYRAHIELLAISGARDRVLAAVQAGYFDKSAKELASRIKLSPEACYRALRVLCREGRMLQTGRGRYVLASA